MTSGGHARSGPPPTEGSARSEARGVKLTALPSEGYKGEVPEWPISPKPSGTERDYWERAWRTPQACLWARPEWRWLVPDVARWVRLSVRCDDPEANAALLGRLPAAKDDVGMSPAGLARMGAKVAPDEVNARAAEAPAETPRRSSRDRLKVVPGAAAGA